MTRYTYRLLLALLPSWFREEYAGEMLWIFDQTKGNGAALICDVAACLVRLRLWNLALWQCILLICFATLPYFFGFWVWKNAGMMELGPPVTNEVLLRFFVLSLMITALLVCVACVGWFRQTVLFRGMVRGRG